MAVANTRLLLEGRHDELVEPPPRRDARPPADEELFEGAAHLRDAVRTVETLRDRQQKIASTGLGDRDVFGLKLDRAAGRLRCFQMRGGRVVDRVELGRAIRGGARCRRGSRRGCLRRCKQFYGLARRWWRSVRLRD